MERFDIKEKIAIATPDRLPAIIEGLERGIQIEEIHALTKIDMWFLQELRDIYQVDLKALQDTLGQADRNGDEVVLSRAFQMRQLQPLWAILNLKYRPLVNHLG